MSQLLGSAEATLNGGSAGAELPVCRKAKPRLKQTKAEIAPGEQYSHAHESRSLEVKHQ